MPARPVGPISQLQFLISLGLGQRVQKLLDSAPNDERRKDIQQGAKRLIDPLGMGMQYQVMGVVPLAQSGASGQGADEEVYPFIDMKAAQKEAESKVGQESDSGRTKAP